MKKLLHFLPPYWYSIRAAAVHVLLLCVVAGTASARPAAAQAILDRKVTLRVEVRTITETLHQIAEQADIRFVYSQQLLNADRKVTVQA